MLLSKKKYEKIDLWKVDRSKGMINMWKITFIESENPLKQGFESEEEAIEWLDRSRNIETDDCKILEMSEEEEEEFLEHVGEDEDLEKSIEKFKMDTSDDDEDITPGEKDSSLGDDDLSELTIHDGEDI